MSSSATRSKERRSGRSCHSSQFAGQRMTVPVHLRTMVISPHSNLPPNEGNRPSGVHHHYPHHSYAQQHPQQQHSGHSSLVGVVGRHIIIRGRVPVLKTQNPPTGSSRVVRSSSHLSSSHINVTLRNNIHRKGCNNNLQIRADVLVFFAGKLLIDALFPLRRPFGLQRVFGRLIAEEIRRAERGAQQ